LPNDRFELAGGGREKTHSDASPRALIRLADVGRLFGLRMLSRTCRTPPGFIEPCLPSPTEQPPNGPGWLHEIKLDGFRLMARRDAAGVRLLTRNGLDWSRRYPAIAAAVAALSCRSCLIDGEVVICGKDGIPVFDRLRYDRAIKTEAVLFAFDLLELEARTCVARRSRTASASSRSSCAEQAGHCTSTSISTSPAMWCSGMHASSGSRGSSASASVRAIAAVDRRAGSK